MGRRELKTADFIKHCKVRTSLGQLQKEKALGYGVRITLFPNAYHPIAGHAGSGLGTCRHENVALSAGTDQFERSRRGRVEDRIPWEGLPLERMCRHTLEGPLDIPLHPAAESFWRERGYLR